MTQLTSICEMACQIVQKKLEEKQIEEEQAAKAQNRKLPVCYDDDDDEEESNSLKDNIISELPPCSAVTPSEPIDSLSMGDEQLDTILAMESDEFIKSCVENLVPNLNFSEKIFSNSLFEEEIISIKKNQHHFNAESDLVESMLNLNSSIISSSSKIDSLLDEFAESMLNRDSSIISSSKIDSLFYEFAGELTLLKSIPPGINETDCDPENEFHLTKRLLYDNSSPRPPEEFVSDNSNAEIEYFSPLLSPLRIDLPSNDTFSLPIIKSFHFDIPSFSRPPAKPPDGNTGILNIKMMGDISEQKYEDEHLNTISAMESDEFIKSSVENLVPNPSESKGKNGCDVPSCFTTFSNILFDADYNFYSDNDQSLSNEDFSKKSIRTLCLMKK
nr:hypothetical protein [Tanacetum cinerariifolium]